MIVIIAPTQIGIPNKIFNAIEDPITSYIIVNETEKYLDIRSNNSYFCHQPQNYSRFSWKLFSA